ncbi:MAG: S4 domain-containing protein, partial [Azonexus sp.]
MSDDPWAKWRKPETAPTPAPTPAPAAQEAETPVAPKVRERPTGTLSPVKPATPARVTAKKPYNKPSTAASPPRVHEQSRGGKARDARPPRAERPSALPQVAHDPASAPEGIRLSKVMSERGMCSRREADLWIERGWVLVDGERISELGSRIRPDAEIIISKEAEKDQAKQVTILLNKPVG